MKNFLMSYYTVQRQLAVLMIIFYSTAVCAMQPVPLVSSRTLAPIYFVALTGTGESLATTAEELVWQYIENGKAQELVSFLQKPGVMAYLPYGLNFPRSSFDHRTPLYRAIQLNNPHLAWTLMQHGASFDLPYSYGNTRLFYAVTQLNIGDVSVLLAINPYTQRPYANPNIPNAAGFTPLLALAQTGRVGLVAALRTLWGDAQASMINPEDARTSIAHLLIAAGADINAVDRAGISVIVHALSCPSSELPSSFIALLLRNGLALDARHYSGKTIREVLESYHDEIIDAALREVAARNATTALPSAVLIAVQAAPGSLAAEIIAASDADVDVAVGDLAVRPPELAMAAEAVDERAVEEESVETAAARDALKRQRKARKEADKAARAAARAEQERQEKAAQEAAAREAIAAQAAKKAETAEVTVVVPAAGASSASQPVTQKRNDKKSTSTPPAPVSAEEPDLDGLIAHYKKLDASRPPAAAASSLATSSERSDAVAATVAQSALMRTAPAKAIPPAASAATLREPAPEAFPPLHRAVATFNLPEIIRLLKAGANATYAIPLTAKTNPGMTALHLAAYGGVPGVATKSAITESQKAVIVPKIIDLLVKHDADVFARCAKGFDALAYAVQSTLLSVQAKIAVIDCLAKHHVAFEAIYSSGYSILHMAASLMRSTGFSAVEVMDALCSRIDGAPAWYAHSYDGTPGMKATALGVAMKYSDVQTMIYLLQRAGVGTYVQDAIICGEIEAILDQLTEIGFEDDASQYLAQDLVTWLIQAEDPDLVAEYRGAAAGDDAAGAGVTEN
jgi:hypothetical protein